MTRHANGDAQPYSEVLTALSTLSHNVDQTQKKNAHTYLDNFQKSTDAWTSTFRILEAADATAEAKLFAATTLKGKITYDLHQLPRDSLPSLRDTLLTLLKASTTGPKPTRTQLCVCLANLAIQMLEWKDVLPMVVSTLGSDDQSVACMLEFLQVLPEEVTEGRKISLSEDELNLRTAELLQDNSQQVLQLLVQYSQSSASAAKKPELLACIRSWLHEVSLEDITNSPLLNTAINALDDDQSFDSAVECLSAILAETKDVDESIDAIKTIYPRVTAIRPRIAAAADDEDSETLKGVTRIFAEAAEAWVVLIARLPNDFRQLVEAVLECAARDKEREAVNSTFNFWYELKQLLVLDRYIESRAQYADIYSNLVDVLIECLQYPTPDSGDEEDLFEGDREGEDKFKDFRHQMGDVLKDASEVIGITETLGKPYQLIERWVQAHGSQARDGSIPQWQALEAPLFAIRSLGQQVDMNENIMLPKLIPLIPQIPDHEKVRYQAVLALGRYTEWTSKHPETLQQQLDFIMANFEHSSPEVVRAAALSFKFCCWDCAELLKDYMPQLQRFYESKVEKLQPVSQDEISQGVSFVLNVQPLDKIYSLMKLCCDPIMERLKTMAQTASTEPEKKAIAEHVLLLTTFIQNVVPSVETGQTNPAVQYCQEIYPVLAKIVEVFPHFMPILERVCRCWRTMFLSYRSAMAPLLPQVADALSKGFASSRQGCFLWATDSLIREFSDGAENVDPATSNAIFEFAEQQATSFLRILNDISPEELPDVIEDFFRLEIDVLLYYPARLLNSALMPPILEAATYSMGILKEDPLIATLHFLRDLLGYGGEQPPQANPEWDHYGNEWRPRPNPPEVQQAVRTHILTHGEPLTKRVLSGMMYSFPGDCFPDASGVLLGMFQILPHETLNRIKATLEALPQGSITPAESQRLVGGIEQRIASGEFRRVRTILQDFTNSFRRRHVAPREGLGALEAARFRFSG